MPSAGDAIFLVVLISLSGALAPRLLGDADIGWHIRDGQQILQSHTLPRVDSFSSTMSGKPWYAWEWLYDVIIAGVHHLMGLNGVVFFTALVVAFTFFLVLRFCLASGANLPLSGILLAIAIGASAIHLLARPHVLSWLFALIWFHVLDDWESSSSLPAHRRLFWLPALMVLWVNVHGGFLAGIILLFLFLAAEIIQRYMARERHHRPAASRLRTLAAVTGLSLLATLLNPYGYRLHLHIYRYLSDRFLMNHIQEFHSPDFHGAAEQCFAALVLITILALALAREKIPVAKLLVVLFAVSSGLYASRNLPVSAILLVVIVAPLLSRPLAMARTNMELPSWPRVLLSRADRFASRIAQMESSLRGHLWPAMAVLLGLWICLHGGRLGSAQVMNARFDARRFPVEAVQTIRGRNLRDPIFCPDSWGGYLIYRLYPQVKVVADDRHDLYGSDFFQKYSDLMSVSPGWQQLLDAEHVEWVLVPVKSPLAERLRNTSPWAVEYEDATAVLFNRK